MLLYGRHQNRRWGHQKLILDGFGKSFPAGLIGGAMLSHRRRVSCWFPLQLWEDRGESTRVFKSLFRTSHVWSMMMTAWRRKQRLNSDGILSLQSMPSMRQKIEVPENASSCNGKETLDHSILLNRHCRKTCSAVSATLKHKLQALEFKGKRFAKHLTG